MSGRLWLSFVDTGEAWGMERLRGEDVGDDGAKAEHVDVLEPRITAADAAAQDTTCRLPFMMCY